MAALAAGRPEVLTQRASEFLAAVSAARQRDSNRAAPA